jgi:DNA replication protein DnaC
MGENMTPIIAPDASELEERRILAEALLRELPPALLRSFDLRRHPNRPAHAQVMAWQPSAAGLMLVGATGKGKSRSLLQLIHRLAFEGVRVTYWSAPRLADRISGLAFEDVGELDKLLRRLEGSTVLALDDFGAFKPTERVAASLHRVIDTRYSAGRPILISTNCSPAELQRQLLDEYGRTIRRLQEMTQAIQF